jgi:hypothetical protein
MGFDMGNATYKKKAVLVCNAKYLLGTEKKNIRKFGGATPLYTSKGTLHTITLTTCEKAMPISKR